MAFSQYMTKYEAPIHLHFCWQIWEVKAITKYAKLAGFLNTLVPFLYIPKRNMTSIKINNFLHSGRILMKPAPVKTLFEIHPYFPYRSGTLLGSYLEKMLDNMIMTIPHTKNNRLGLVKIRALTKRILSFWCVSLCMEEHRSCYYSLFTL